MANWGLNLDDSLEPVNPFLRRNSVVTVMVSFLLDLKLFTSCKKYDNRSHNIVV